MLKTDLGKIRTGFCFKKDGKNVLLPGLKVRKTQSIPSCASDLILYVPAILLKKYKIVQLYGSKCDLSMYTPGKPDSAKCHCCVQSHTQAFNVQALSILPLACVIQITASALVLEFGLQHNSLAYHWKNFIWSTHIEQNLLFEALK